MKMLDKLTMGFMIIAMWVMGLAVYGMVDVVSDVAKYWPAMKRLTVALAIDMAEEKLAQAHEGYSEIYIPSRDFGNDNCYKKRGIEYCVSYTLGESNENNSSEGSEMVLEDNSSESQDSSPQRAISK